MPGKNKHLLRYLEPKIRQLLTKKFSGLILGPRQVGKTTLVRDLLEKFDALLGESTIHAGLFFQSQECMSRQQ